MSEHVQTGTFAEAYREVPFHVHKYHMYQQLVFGQSMNHSHNKPS